MNEADTAAAQALAASVQASRDTGCCCVLGEAERDFKESLSPFERIAYWVAVGVTAGLSVAVVFGTAGYVAARVLGL